MAGRIVILPDDLTGKIAAGEVIERPASIVKELMENALDAGASDIVVELEKGGCGSIRIVDNGEGIEAPDVPLAFERFATSKIYRFDDIYRVRSYGFRGEALPSIAAVSRVEMITRKGEALAGTRIIVEAGRIVSVVETGCPVGTSVFVSHIFDAVPVRKKFLKANATEQGYCLDVITRMALSHSGVRIKVTMGSRELLNIPAAGDMSERIKLVMGKDALDHMVHVRGEKEFVKVHGFVSRPEYTRASTKQLYCYVNRRFVRDYLLNHAVMTAYRQLIEAKRYPSAVLFVDLPPEHVDVNVHQAKMEVRFRNPREMYELLVEAIVASLSKISSLPGVSGGAVPLYGDPRKAVQDYGTRVHEALRRYTVSSGAGKLSFGDVRGRKDSLPENERIKAEGESVHGTQQVPDIDEGGEDIRGKGGILFADLEYVGQVAGTYLVFSAHERLILVDQHAAHERVLYERLRRESLERSEGIMSQRLLLPEVVHLSPGQRASLMESAVHLAETGIEVESFGGDAVVLKSVPAMVSHVEPGALVYEILDLCAKTERPLSRETMKQKILTLVACKAAIKANHFLSVSEVKELCRDLDATPFSSTCPHGRPVSVSFSLREVERMFKRR